jgi:hypothetical protein
MQKVGACHDIDFPLPYRNTFYMQHSSPNVRHYGTAKHFV